MRQSIAMKRHLPLCVLLLLGAGVQSGCAFLEGLLTDVLQKPTLTFQRVNLRDLTFVGLGVDLDWRIDNPNDFGIDLASVEYEFEVDGHLLARGKSAKGIQIAPSASSTLTLPFDVVYREMARSILALYQKTEVPFTVKGHFGFDTPVGVIRVPFRKAGTLPVPRLPRVQITGARLARLTLGGATLEVDVQLSNENRFPLPLERLTYSLELEGKRVASGTASVPQASATGSRTVKLPIRLDFLSSGLAVASAIRSGKVDVALDGKVKIGPVEAPVNVRRQIVLRR